MYTVLLIDDDEKIVKLNTDVLQWHRYDVMTAYSLGEAEARLSEKLPDLIVLGVDMSDGDGLDYCRRLKASYNLPIILISGENGNVPETEGLRSGADDYIVKPYDISVLMARIEANIGKYCGNAQGGTEK